MPINDLQETDWIHIHDLKILTRIGVYAWEQQINQTLLVNIDCLVDLSVPITDLSQSVDYAAVSELITDFIEKGSFALIEMVAQQVADLILGQFPVKKVKVSVKKCHAIANASGVSVSIVRERR